MADTVNTDIEAEVAAFEAQMAPEQSLVVQSEHPVGTVVAGVQETSVLDQAIKLASIPGIDKELLATILAANEREVARQAEQQFNVAFHAMRRRMPRIRKNGEVWYKNKETQRWEKSFTFARFEDVMISIEPVLEEHEFDLDFTTEQRAETGGGLVVTGFLRHTAGHSRRASIPLALDTSGGKNNIQAGASTFSYGKRYTTTMLLNLVMEGEDDDGNTGGTRFLSEEQIAALQALTVETKTVPKVFFQTMLTEPIEGWEDIPSVHYDRLMNTLRNKRRLMTKGEPTP